MKYSPLIKAFAAEIRRSGLEAQLSTHGPVDQYLECIYIPDHRLWLRLKDGSAHMTYVKRIPRIQKHEEVVATIINLADPDAIDVMFAFVKNFKHPDAVRG